jgi:hypothetical protein
MMIGQAFDMAAFPANQVMMRGGGGDFINRFAVNFTCNEQVQVTKKVQGAINSGPIDGRLHRLDALADFVGRDVIPHRANRI